MNSKRRQSYLEGPEEVMTMLKMASPHFWMQQSTFGKSRLQIFRNCCVHSYVLVWMWDQDYDINVNIDLTQTKIQDFCQLIQLVMFFYLCGFLKPTELIIYYFTIIISMQLSFMLHSHWRLLAVEISTAEIPIPLLYGRQTRHRCHENWWDIKTVGMKQCFIALRNAVY